MGHLLAQKYKKNISENALLLFYTVIKMSCLHQRFSLQEQVEFTGKEAEVFKQCLIQNLPGKINLKTAVLNSTGLCRVPALLKFLSLKAKMRIAAGSPRTNAFFLCFFE